MFCIIFWNPVKFSMFFPLIFRLAKQTILKKKHGKFHGTQKFNAKLSLKVEFMACTCVHTKLPPKLQFNILCSSAAWARSL